MITFCVCLEFRQTGIKQSLFFTYLTTFSLISSIGIAIGIAVTEAHSHTVDPVLSATLEGIAAGSLIYVVMFEVRTVPISRQFFDSSIRGARPRAVQGGVRPPAAGGRHPRLLHHDGHPDIRCGEAHVYIK